MYALYYHVLIIFILFNKERIYFREKEKTTEKMTNKSKTK